MKLALWMVIVVLTLQEGSPRPVQSVPAVDLDRYAGLWYEVARFPNRFQQKCRGETTARYEQLPDGELRVVKHLPRCRWTMGRLLILDLTADYGAALVGTPSREYLWVLSRTPQLEDTTFQRLVATAAAQGFDVARLARSP